MNSYEKYLQSEEWQVVRARILKRSKGKCEKCRLRPAKQVHHKTYVRLGNELDEDLMALCPVCHQTEHPDKLILSASFVGLHQCKMCPQETAEIFVGDLEILYLCTGCGETDRKPLTKRRSNRRRQPRNSAAEKPTAEERQKLKWDKAQARHDEKVRRGSGKTTTSKEKVQWRF